MNKKFLEDAIADAKTIKEAAIASAKASIEESFTPHIQSMISAKLQEMDSEEEVNESEEVNENETVEENINLDEIEAELTEEYLTSESTTINEEDKEGNEEEEEKEEGEEGSEEEEEEIDLENMTDEDLTSYVEEVVTDMIASGEIEPGESFGSEEEGVEGEEVEGAEDFEMTGEEEVVAESEEKVNESTEEVNESETVEESEAPTVESLQAELKEMKKELYEAYNTVKVQKETLQGTQLLNAKLLYTNKIFLSNQKLNESTMEKVLGAFDKAKTVKETKLVYETLKENISPKTNKTVNKSIMGIASKAVETIKEGKTSTKTKDTVPVDAWVKRNQKLAGII